MRVLGVLRATDVCGCNHYALSSRSGTRPDSSQQTVVVHYIFVEWSKELPDWSELQFALILKGEPSDCILLMHPQSPANIIK